MLIKQNQLVINGTTLEQSDLQAIANVASDVQAQIDTKAPINNAQFTGNVGIGTGSPAQKLHIEDTSASVRQRFVTSTSNQVSIDFGDTDSGSVGRIQYDHYTDALSFNTSNAEHMRIDSSGNVGIGDNITKTWSLGKALHIGNAENSLWGEGDYAFHLVQNGYYNGGWKYTHSDAATMYSQSDGGQYWYHAGNGTADNALTWTPTMRLDTSGNLLVGRSSNLAAARTLVSGTKSGTNGTNGQLVVLDEQSYSTTDNGGGISFAGDFYNGGQVVFATIQGVKANNTDANDAGALKFTTKANGANQVEAMRIDSGGNLIVGNAGVSFTSDRLQVKSPVGEPVASFYRPRNTAGGGLVRFMSDVGGTQTIVAQVTSEGNFVTNGGINFGGSVNSGGVTSSSNTLDDYEEGTWTPTTSSGTMSNGLGSYVKIGAFVTLIFRWSSISGGSGQVSITGLPFTRSTSLNNLSPASGNCMWDGINTTRGITPYLGGNNMTFYGNGSGNSNTWWYLQHSDANGGTQPLEVYGSIWYYTDQ